MERTRILRWVVACAAGVGLFLGWSSPVFDLDEWREEQMAKALELASADIDAQLASESSQSLNPQPLPLPSSQLVQQEPVPTATPRPSTFGSMSLDCDAQRLGVQAQCVYGQGQTFSIQVHVDYAPVGGYLGFQTRLRWIGTILEYLPSDSAADEALWSDCSFPTRNKYAENDATLLFACLVFPAPASGFTQVGPVLQFEMRCSKPGDAPISFTPRTDEGTLGTFFMEEDGAAIDPLLAGAGVTCSSLPEPTPTLPAEAPTAPPPVPTPDPDLTDSLPPVPNQQDDPALPGTIFEKLIPEAGGKIDSVDGRVTIEFPDEAVAEPLEIRVTHEDVSLLPAIPGHPFMTAWEFEAFAVERGMAKVRHSPRTPGSLSTTRKKIWRGEIQTRSDCGPGTQRSPSGMRLQASTFQALERSSLK